jgi:superoxide reductase
MNGLKFYHCSKCGNIVDFLNVSGVPVMCCGEKMSELIPNVTDAAQEKHVPVISARGNTVKVCIGSAVHPMTEEHYIQWICLKTKMSRQFVMLDPSSKPEAVFALTEGDEPVAAFAYCNLHGLWRACV